MTNPDLAAHMGAVARKLLGEPNKRLSRKGELRFGTHGSVAVDLAAGTYYDHENKIGGGVLDLIERETGRANGAAVAWLRDELGVELEARAPEPGRAGRPVAVYDYRTATGALTFQVCRHRGKRFSQRRPDGRGGWIPNLEGVEPVPYRLPELLAADPAAPAYVPEGEKDCDNLARLGLVATCNPGGVGKWRDAFAHHFAGRDVVVLPDNDRRGREHARAVAASLAPVAASVKVLELPALPDKGDVSDWIEGGGTAERLAELAAAPTWDPPEGKGGLRVLEAGDFLALAIPEREMLLEPVLPAQGLAMLHAARGVGKTHVALEMAYAVASGGAVFRWRAPAARPVVYVDGEMPARTMQERLAAVVEGNEAEPPEGYLRFILADLHENGLPDLASDEGQRAIETALGDAKLLVLDNLSSLVRSGRENEADSWQPVQDFLLRLRRKGVSVLLVHHDGKGGQQRGTSRREDVLDTVVGLRRPENYRPSEGARFEVHVEKARGVAGEAVDPFEARLEVRDKAAVWTTRTLEDATLQRVIAMTKDGLKVRDIASETGMSVGKVSKLQRKATETGQLIQFPKRGGRGGRRFDGTADDE